MSIVAWIRPAGRSATATPGTTRRDVAVDLYLRTDGDVESILDTLPPRLQEYDDLLEYNPIWLERTKGIGVISADECNAYGITGPTLRAAGVQWDLRKAFPYSGIDQYDFDIPVGTNGDVYDRYRVRVDEIHESMKIVRQVRDTSPNGDYRIEDRKVTPPPRSRIDESMEALIHHFKIFTEGFKVPPGETYVAIESPRGELGCYLVSNGEGKPYRMHTRAPSFTNLQALPIMMADTLVADTVAAIASSSSYDRSSLDVSGITSNMVVVSPSSSTSVSSTTATATAVDESPLLLLLMTTVVCASAATSTSSGI